MLRKITIKFKIIFLSAFSIAIALLLVGLSLRALNVVGDNLIQIAEEDVPLTNSMCNITNHQLEQAVMFERATRLAEIMETDSIAKERYEASKRDFLKISQLVDEEVQRSENKIQNILAEEEKGSKQWKEFSHVLELVKNIDKEHADFEHHIKKVLELYEQGKFLDAEALAENIDTEEEQLDNELEAALEKLEEFTENASEEAEHAQKASFSKLVTTITFSTIVTVILSLLLIRAIIGPLKNLHDAMVRISGGDLETAVPASKNEDETADMARALEVFREQGLRNRQMEEEALKTQARAEEQKRQIMMTMASDFDAQVGGVISSLASASAELQSTAENMKQIADNTSGNSQTVASAAEEASSNVNNVASAMEEMSASAKEIASQIFNVKTRSNNTAENAHKANKTVGNLNELAENIGTVVEAIQDIAEQTNLLALNATIEAARAGDAGKGFAVVAEEVKKLATETGIKTEEISSRITEIQEATHASVSAMQKIISDISGINESVTGVSAAVEEQNATTSEITRSVSEASLGAQQVSQIIVDVQHGAQETGSSADALLSASNEVAKLSDSLKNSVELFLEKIRTDNSKSGR